MATVKLIATAAALLLAAAAARAQEADGHVHISKEGARQWAALTEGVRSRVADGPDEFFGFIPEHRATVPPGQQVKWNTPCFKDVTAHLEMPGDANAYPMLHISVGAHAKGAKLACQAGFLIGFVGGLDIKWFYAPHGNQTTHFRYNYTEAQMWDMNTFGVRVYEFPDGLRTSLTEVVATIKLLAGTILGYDRLPDWTVQDNLKFLTNHVNYTLEKREITTVEVPATEVHPGDMLVLLRLAGFSPVVMWAMGSHVGHTSIVVEIDGVLSVCEANNGNAIWDRDIDCGPYDEYLRRVEKRDYLVAILPLSPKSRAQFDNDAAVKYIKDNLVGIPYGYHNMLASWIDTAEDNYPGKVDSSLWQLLMTWLDWAAQDILHLGTSMDLITMGFNKRIGTVGLGPAEVFMEAAKRGISFTELSAMPEMDEWTYENTGSREGPSIICCTLVAAAYKAGGLFGEYADQIQATEFSLYDVYSLNIFDSDYKRPEQCVQADPNLPYCQIFGKYRLVLEDSWNSVDPHPHMKERCESKAPSFYRTPGC